MDTIKGKRFTKENFDKKVFDKVKFDDCVFYNCNFNHVTWNKCQFKNTSILGVSSVKNSVFIECKFLGQHTHMGGATKYTNCEFTKSKFENIQFWDSEFIDCKFSGKAINIVFYGSEAPKEWQTKFNNVDITELELEFVDFRCNFDLSKTIIKPE